MHRVCIGGHGDHRWLVGGSSAERNISQPLQPGGEANQDHHLVHGHPHSSHKGKGGGRRHHITRKDPGGGGGGNMVRENG